MACPAVITGHRGGEPSAWRPGHRDLLHSVHPVLRDHRGFEAAATADGYRNAGPGSALGSAVIDRPPRPCWRPRRPSAPRWRPRQPRPEQQ